MKTTTLVLMALVSGVIAGASYRMFKDYQDQFKKKPDDDKSGDMATTKGDGFNFTGPTKAGVLGKLAGIMGRDRVENLGQGWCRRYRQDPEDGLVITDFRC
jgi:hypothetical protein